MAFDKTYFYILNSTALSGYTLSAGQAQDTKGNLGMTANAFSSSENWQLLSQGGRYFIRNFDYGAGFQLGLSETDRSTPKLYKTSGSILQQWSILQFEGGYQLVNGLLGNGTTLNLRTSAGIPPIMQASSPGTTWTITRNPR